MIEQKLKSEEALVSDRADVKSEEALLSDRIYSTAAELTLSLAASETACNKSIISQPLIPSFKIISYSDPKSHFATKCYPWLQISKKHRKSVLTQLHSPPWGIKYNDV